MIPQGLFFYILETQLFPCTVNNIGTLYHLIKISSFVVWYLFILLYLLVKERGNEGTKGQTAKKEVPKIEKDAQKYGKASMYTFLKESRQKHWSS